MSSCPPKPRLALLVALLALAGCQSRSPLSVTQLQTPEQLARALDCTPLRPHGPGAPISSQLDEVCDMKEAQEYYAEYATDCGLRLMKLARSESGPFEFVFPLGEQRPDQKLRGHAWRTGRFMIRGRMTGKQRESPECGSWPEFEVFDFKPWGEVRRCASPGAADLTMLLYTGGLPETHYAPEDFVDGPWPPLIDDESCRPTEQCAENEHSIKSCTGKAWCCRVLPRDDKSPQ